MTTHTASCKPELILLGRSMLQGFVGGILAVMALLLSFNIGGVLWDSFIVIFWAAILLVIAGVLGAIKAIPFWALNCFLRSPLRVVPRIIMGGVVSTSLWMFWISDGHTSNGFIVLSSGAVFLLSLPTSLLIGSRVRVGKFFSFGIGGLPLRLLSTCALLFCVLACTSWRLLGEDVQQDVMFRYFPLVYFSSSLYLTIKPPHKTVLLIAALGLNAPLGMVLTLSNEFQRDYGWYSGETTALRILCITLLAAWAIFIPTAKKRLRIDTSHATPAIACERDPHHECLGSRFTEWQQRVA